MQYPGLGALPWRTAAVYCRGKSSGIAQLADIRRPRVMLQSPIKDRRIGRRLFGVKPAILANSGNIFSFAIKLVGGSGL